MIFLPLPCFAFTMHLLCVYFTLFYFKVIYFPYLSPYLSHLYFYPNITCTLLFMVNYRWFFLPYLTLLLPWIYFAFTLHCFILNLFTFCYLSPHLPDLYFYPNFTCTLLFYGELPYIYFTFTFIYLYFYLTTRIFPYDHKYRLPLFTFTFTLQNLFFHVITKINIKTGGYLVRSDKHQIHFISLAMWWWVPCKH